MSRSPRSVEERALKRWISFEAAGLNASLARKKKTVAAMMAEEEPSYDTKDGQRVQVDKRALRAIHSLLDAEERNVERLPADLVIDSSLDNLAYVTLPGVSRALRSLEGFGDAYPFRAGRMHLPLPVAIDLPQKYPGILQTVFLVG